MTAALGRVETRLSDTVGSSTPWALRSSRCRSDWPSCSDAPDASLAEMRPPMIRLRRAHAPFVARKTIDPAPNDAAILRVSALELAEK